MAERMQRRIMTNDFNLNKIATLRGLEVINLNDLAKALRPVVLPGEPMDIEIVKPGESANQGVGYLEDGTMVVVEGGAAHLKETVHTTVTSTLQTSAGRMIFTKYESSAAPSTGHKKSGRERGSKSDRDSSQAGASQTGGEAKQSMESKEKSAATSAPGGSDTKGSSGSQESGENTSNSRSEPPAGTATGRNPRRVR